MKLAIVILNWNGVKLLEQFIPSIIKNNFQNADIFVADNASTDNSIHFVKENFPEVKIIQNKDNGGYAKGYNDALKQIKADIFCLINSDVEVTKNWLPPILDIFNKEHKTAIIQPKILDFKEKSKFEYAGAGGGFIDRFAYPYCRGRIFDSLEKDKNQFNDVKEIFWASGACFFIRANVFNDLGGFDEDYFAHQEEIDLCWRAFNENYIIKYVGKSTVYHVGGATLNEASPFKSYLNFRNSLFTILKNAPSKHLIFLIFFRLTLDGIAGVKFLFDLKPLHTLAIIRAHFGFYKRLFKFIKKRKKLNCVRRKDYYKKSSIVWEYFIKNNKKYSDL